MHSDLGRGPTATLDMTRRIAALNNAGIDIIDALWQRLLDAERGDGFDYEYVAADHE
jgi:hypothetical protein